MNDGKKFEQDFMNSIPDEIFKYRLRDSSGAWTNLGNGQNTRFTPSNICDLIVYDNTELWLLELKSHKGKSLPLSCIRKKQLEGLIDAEKKPGVNAGFIVNFRDLEETYFVYATWIETYQRDNPEKKSISISYFRDKGILIPQQKKKVRYKYDLSVLLYEVF